MTTSISSSFLKRIIVQCPNKHGNLMTTSISPLFLVGFFRYHNFVVSQLKHLTPRDFQNDFYTIKINEDIRKFVQIPVYWKSTKLFKCLILRYKENRPHFGKLIRLSILISFINFWKYTTIFKSSLNCHVYWDTLL